MIDFDFINPTRIIFGKDKEKNVGKIISDYGFKRVLLVYGGGSIKRNGLYDTVKESLAKEGLFVSELGGISANPDRSFSEKGVGIARLNNCDIILAVGGGSVIDVAKSIGVGFYYEGSPFDFNLYKATPSKCLPIGVILTISSAGSESSNSCVISDNELHIKQGFNSDIVRPLFAIENPELTYSVPPYQTAAGITDIMMHSLERFFSPSDPYQLSDDWALSLCLDVMKAGKKAIEDPNDYEARAALMLDSSLSHDGLTSIGKKQVFVVHPLEHAISAYHPNITHGAGIAVVFLGFASYLATKDTEKLSLFARRLFNIASSSSYEEAIMGIARLKDYYLSIGMPTSLEDLGLSKEDIPAISSIATRNGTHVIGCYPQPLDEKAVIDIYSRCLRK